MLRNEVLKYILDIENVILELEKILELHAKDYTKFSENFMAVRTTERDLMIIGEAVNKLIKIEPDIKISGAKTNCEFEKYDCSCL